MERQRLARPGGRRPSGHQHGRVMAGSRPPRAARGRTAGGTASDAPQCEGTPCPAPRLATGAEGGSSTAAADGDDMVPDAGIPSRGWAPAIASLLARGPRGAAFPLACRTPRAGGVRAYHGQEGHTGSIGHGFRPPVISYKRRAIARALARTSAVHAAVRYASCDTILSCGAAVSASRHCRVVFVTPPTAPRFRTARADLPSCVEPLDH